jgi:hypothetical protein
VGEEKAHYSHAQGSWAFVDEWVGIGLFNAECYVLNEVMDCWVYILIRTKLRDL